ncbi:hypothetical protein [Knoellia sp. LjRoot47]|uniref:hypothetical protein n=1 Tax=Knoellia sp. LjRoot47 TaxID=3342330 RepID=UPI003ED11D41
MESLTQRLFCWALTAVLALVVYGQAQEHLVTPANAGVARFSACLDAAASGSSYVTGGRCR